MDFSEEEELALPGIILLDDDHKKERKKKTSFLGPSNETSKEFFRIFFMSYDLVTESISSSQHFSLLKISQLLHVAILYY